MQKLAGVQLHPGARALIGAAFIALGVVRGDAIPVMLIGGVLILWTVIAIAAGRR